MLYQIYETQRSVMEPFADFAMAASRLYGNPGLPIRKTPFAQRMSAAYELFYRLAKDYEKPAFGITTVDVEGVEVAIHERIELDKPFCELRRFKRFSDDPETLTNLKNQPVVLVVAPLSGHYATLLRDTVRTMLQGHKVYITDWKNARMVPLSEGEFHLDDYVNYVQEFLRHLQGKYGNCHVMSVCQPTVPVMAAVSLMASRGEKTPLSLTMMGGPIDASMSPTTVNNLAVDKGYEWFENNVIYPVPDSFPGKGRRVYPGFLQHTGFLAMNPDRHSSNHYDFFKNLVKGDDTSTEAHRAFYDEYNAVLDMDAHYYLETIETVFQKYKLINGTWDVRSPSGKLERVRPQDITTGALLTIEGELDDISGLGQTRAAHTLCTGLAEKKPRHFEVKGAGHYGIFSGRRWRETVYPLVRDFIAEHDADHEQPKPAARVTTLGKPAPTAPKALAAPVKAAPVKAKAAAKPVQAKAAMPASKASATQSAASKPVKAAKKARAQAVPEPVARTGAASASAPAASAPTTPVPAPVTTKPVTVSAATTSATVPIKDNPVVDADTSKSTANDTPATRWVGATPTPSNTAQPSGAAAAAAESKSPAVEKVTTVTAAPPETPRKPASRSKA